MTVVTVVTVTVVGLLAARGRVRSVEDFISLRDSAGQGTMAATIVASSMGAWILFSPAEAGAASFLVLNEAFPAWVTLVVVVLAVLLVTSSADTMFNAIASVVTADRARLVEDADQESLWVGGRALTVAVALCAIVVGAQGYSVLDLFLTADLLATAVFVPFLAGRSTERLSGAAGIAISLVGIAVVAASFPMLRGLLSVVTGLGGALPTPSLLAAFVGATFVPAVLTAAATTLSDPAADLDAVDREVRRLDEPVADGGRDASTTEVDGS